VPGTAGSTGRRGACAVTGPGVRELAGQAGVFQTVMTACAIRVPVSPPAPGNPGQALILRALCRFRAMTVRHLLIALARAA